MENIFKLVFFKLYNLLNYVCNNVTLKRKHVSFDDSLIINGRISIYGDGEITIDDNVVINSSENSNPIGGDKKTIFNTRHGGFIHIGQNCGISNSSIIAYAGVTIGNSTFLGGSCKIYDTDFHSLSSRTRDLSSQEDVKKKRVKIGNNVFIGAHSIILKGVTIGNEAIVGAGSVVTKDIPPGEIWAGNPAKFIRKVNDV